MIVRITEKELNNNNGSGGLEIQIPEVIGNPTDMGASPVFIEEYEGDIRVCIWNGEEDPQVIVLKRKGKGKK